MRKNCKFHKTLIPPIRVMVSSTRHQLLNATTSRSCFKVTDLLSDTEELVNKHSRKKKYLSWAGYETSIVLVCG